MKKITLLLALAIVSFALNAQISYTSSEYTVAKDSFLITTGSAFNMASANFDSAGANIFWDYDTLPMTSQKMMQYGDNNYPLYKSTFVASCVAACIDGGGTNFACTSTCNAAWNKNNLTRPTLDSIELNGVQLSDGIDVLTKSNASLSQEIIAYTMNISGVSIPLLIGYSATDSIYHFPLDYTNKDSSEYSYAIDLNSYGIPLAYTSNKKRINHVEGWGQLSTPYKNYPNVLKLKTIIERQDTIAIDTIKIGQGVIKTVKYSWFASGYKIPVLEVMGQILNGVEQITTVLFLDTVRCLTPEALFSYSPVSSFLSGGDSVEVHFTNQSINSNSFSWDFDDGASGSANTSAIQHPTHWYNTSGTYAVELIACNDAACQPIACDTVTIPVIILDSTQVIANFKYLPAHPCMGDTVHFINTSINATSYDWNFGDGGSSILKNPPHYYTAAGIYTVTLESKKAAQTDILTQVITIAGASTIDAIANTVINYGDSVELTVNGGTNATYVWSPSASLSCGVCQSPYGFPKITTTYTITAYDLCGVAGVDTVQVIVNGPAGITKNANVNEMIVYPNPANTLVYVQTKQVADWIRIINIVGEEVITTKPNNTTTSISIESLPAGIYYIQTKNSQGIQVQPLIIQQ